MSALFLQQDLGEVFRLESETGRLEELVRMHESEAARLREMIDKRKADAQKRADVKNKVELILGKVIERCTLETRDNHWKVEFSHEIGANCVSPDLREHWNSIVQLLNIELGKCGFQKSEAKLRSGWTSDMISLKLDWSNLQPPEETMMMDGKNIPAGGASSRGTSPDDKENVGKNGQTNVCGNMVCECPICHELRPMVCLNPCGHLCCNSCHQGLCPFCRKSVFTSTPVFNSINLEHSETAILRKHKTCAI